MCNTDNICYRKLLRHGISNLKRKHEQESPTAAETETKMKVDFYENRILS